MDFEVRPVRDDEIEEFVYINAYAFDRDRGPAAIEEAVALERKWYRPESRLAVFVDGRMAARMHLLPFKMYLNGGAVRTGGIGGVGVLPEYRRRGLTAALLQRGLNDMCESGQVISALYPLHYELYRRYGWEIVSASVRYSFSPKDVHVTRPAPGECRRVTADEWASLDAVYREYAAHHNGSLERDEFWWREAVFGSTRDSRDVAVWETGGQIKGYVAYGTRSFSLPERFMPASTLWVRELVALDGDSYAGLVGYLLHHDLQERIEWASSSEEPLLHVLNDPSKVKTEIGWPQMALRLVDVPRALEARPCLPAADGARLTIAVQDVVAGWNDGAWRLEVTGGRLRAGPATSVPDLTVEVGTLAALYAGRLSVREAARAGLLEARSERVLERAGDVFAVASSFRCLDWF